MNQSYTVWLELQVVTQNARIPSRLLGLEVFHISLLPAKSGDVFVTDPGELHWHGASPNKKMTHIAIQADIEWSNNQVNESEYKKTCLETKK